MIGTRRSIFAFSAKTRATCVAFALGCASGLPARAEAPSFDVLSYDVQLAVDFEGARVSGAEVIRFKSLSDDLRVLSFSANSLTVTASIDGASMVVAETVGERLLFHLAWPMRRGQAGRLVVSFTGAAPKGLVFRGAQVFSTYFTCDYMICDQERPGDKARVAFQLTLPSGMEAVAPGRRLANPVMTRGAEIWRWRERRPTPAYLLGFAAGRFRRVVLPGTAPQLPVLAARGDADEVAAMFADTRRMVAFFEEKSGVRYAEPAYTQVLVDESAAQEAASHATIGRAEIEPILKDPHEDWVIAHELAHQWWGNAVTCADWSELWLNEGLTVFMVAAYKEARWGRADYERELALANKRWQVAKDQGFDVPLSWQGTYPSLKLKRAMAYAKAVVFFDTLRRELGDATFWRAIRIYTRAHWGGTVRARDLQRAMERAAGRDLSALFDGWVYGGV